MTDNPSSVNPKPDDVTPVSEGSKARQLLGMKGAADGETSIWKIRLQLMKPITWIPLIWGCFAVPLLLVTLCGV